MQVLEFARPFLPERGEIYRLMGYPRGARVSPEVDEVVSRQLREAAELIEPWAGFEQVALAGVKERLVRFAGGQVFRSETVAELLRGCQSVAVSVVTIGEWLEAEATRLMQRGEGVEALALDSIGSAAVEALQRELGKRLCLIYEPEGFHVTRHYSPGYKGWMVEDQAALIAQLRPNGHGLPVRLNEASLMIPRKSLSSLWGLSAMELMRDQAPARLPCRSCDLKGCEFRRMPFDPDVTDMGFGESQATWPDKLGPDTTSAPPDQKERTTRAMTSPLRAVQYGINTRALGKWARLNLLEQPESDQQRHYIFRYMGSTCSSGGVPINSEIHVVLRESETGLVVENGWISLPPNDPGLKHMCEYHTRGEKFVQRLERAPDFCGRRIEDILEEAVPTNPAGCYCTQLAINHKWRMALSTIHYTLMQQLEQSSIA